MAKPATAVATAATIKKALMKDFEAVYSDQRQRDRLAGFAHIAMEALEANGIEDFVLLQHDDLRQWWMERKLAIAAAEERARERERKAELKKQALAKLTPEEKKALGIK